MDKNNESKIPDGARKFLKPYDSKVTEGAIYQKWEESGFFNPDTCIEKGITKSDAEIFSIVLPPPNVTGSLHMGSALMLAIEDIMVRFHRMKGDKTLWLPGTDHAAIATQSVVEKQLAKEDIRKKDLGREKFLEKVNEFASQSREHIVRQMRAVGASLDWSREAFTLDTKRNLAVKTAFKKMFDDGLIYRGYRVVNWDTKGQTSVSDDEVEYEERKTKLYTFKYSNDFPIPIATTRPETKVGDTAVAVNPEDERYKKFVGREYDVVFAGVPLHIKVIADRMVDKDFGTGALGVTPAHSMADYELSLRHNLEMVPVIDEYARMSIKEKGLNGKKTTEARGIVIDWLKKENLLIKEEEIVQNIPLAQRSGGIIEPLPKLQWFIDVNKKITIKKSSLNGIRAGDQKSLKELMLSAVSPEEIKILPDRFEKVYFNWVENLHDWCISRQIWYGHRIPVWYKGEEAYCGVDAPEGDGWTQDEDTLDTWFSSGLWTFSTLGWPLETADLKNYHPTTILETGYDILFFWIARMILMSTYLLGEIPFKTVYLHGLVRDEKGRKISKSLGNNIDPIEVIEQFGADAVRMALIIGTGPGNDSKISNEKIKAYKHFANKIWNITRFVLENTAGVSFDETPELTGGMIDVKAQLDTLINDVTKDTEEYRFYIAGEKLYHYVWHTFADIIIETCKKELLTGTPEKKYEAQWFLQNALKTILKLLHPFMPFITEEIWQSLPQNKNNSLLMIEPWPPVRSRGRS
ncbi:MAG: valine--tRNA ligase [bacterium]|nr:valine--tRNA ligase [bacterium]